MGKKLKALAGIKESAQQIWLAGLGAFAKAQEGGSKVFDTLVKEGESIQLKTRTLTDAKIAKVAGAAAGTWDRLEQAFEDRVARSLSSLGVPNKEDIDALSGRLAELSAVVQELTEARAKAEEKQVIEPSASLVEEIVEETKETSETPVDQAVTETLVDQAVTETLVDQAVTETLVNQAVTEILVNQAVTETLVDQPVTKSAVTKTKPVVKKVSVKKVVAQSKLAKTDAKPATKKPALKKIAAKKPAIKKEAVTLEALAPIPPVDLSKNSADSNG